MQWRAVDELHCGAVAAGSRIGDGHAHALPVACHTRLSNADHQLPRPRARPPPPPPPFLSLAQHHIAVTWRSWDGVATLYDNGREVGRSCAGFGGPL